MSSAEVRLAVRGPLMHAPVLGEVEAFADALVTVGASGRILALAPDAGAAAPGLLAELERRGVLHTLGAGEYLLPGLVDAHVHAPQWPHLGKALDVPLNVWLEQYTFPLEARCADLDHAERVYQSLVDTLLANGTTTVMYYATIHREASTRLAAICLEHGQRALVGKLSMDHPEQCPDYYRESSTAAAIEALEGFLEELPALAGNEAGLVQPVVTPRFIPSCTDELLQTLGRIAAARGCHVQTHCSEGDWEHGFVLARHGMTDTASLDRFGLLSQKTVLAHCNFIDEADMDTIAARHAGIAHCPLSNLYFANAVFPARRALDRGLQVALGTDIAAGASASILHNCHSAVTASRALEDGVDPGLDAAERGRPGARIDFREAFWMATTGGGLALDLDVGLLAPGYAFDAIVVDTRAPDSDVLVWDDIDSAEDVLQKIIYNAGRRNIRKVWVDGRAVRG